MTDRQACGGQKPDARAAQFYDRMMYGVEHLSYFTVLSLGQRYLQPGVLIFFELTNIARRQPGAIREPAS